MNIKITDAVQVNGETLLTVEYFKMTLHRQQVSIPKRPADSPFKTDETYLADAIKTLQAHCAEDSAAEYECRKDLGALVKEYK